MNDPTRDPAPDPSLQALLAEAPRVPRLGGEAFDELADSITARARLPLARLRSTAQPWWESAAGWWPSALPLSAAAGIVLLFALSVPDADRSPASDAGALGPAPGVEALLGSTLPPAEYELLTGEGEDPSLLLTATLAQR
jgi:hypothetical protein